MVVGRSENKVTNTMVTTLMSEMECLNDAGGVAVIGATNLPNRIDTVCVDTLFPFFNSLSIVTSCALMLG